MENKNSSNTTYWDEIGVCWCFLSDWCVKALIWFSWLENERKLIFRSGSCPHPQQLQHLVLKVWVERVYNTSSGSVLWLLRLFHPALLLPANPEPPPAPNPASCTLIIIPIQSKYKKCTPITANHNVKISGRSKQEDESTRSLNHCSFVKPPPNHVGPFTAPEKIENLLTNVLMFAFVEMALPRFGYGEIFLWIHISWLSWKNV